MYRRLKHSIPFLLLIILIFNICSTTAAHVDPIIAIYGDINDDLNAETASEKKENEYDIPYELSSLGINTYNKYYYGENIEDPNTITFFFGMISVTYVEWSVIQEQKEDFSKQCTHDFSKTQMPMFISTITIWLNSTILTIKFILQNLFYYSCFCWVKFSNLKNVVFEYAELVFSKLSNVVGNLKSFAIDILLAISLLAFSLYILRWIFRSIIYALKRRFNIFPGVMKANEDGAFFHSNNSPKKKGMKNKRQRLDEANEMNLEEEEDAKSADTHLLVNIFTTPFSNDLIGVYRYVTDDGIPRLMHYVYKDVALYNLAMERMNESRMYFEQNQSDEGRFIPFVSSQTKSIKYAPIEGMILPTDISDGCRINSPYIDIFGCIHKDMDEFLNHNMTIHGNVKSVINFSTSHANDDDGDNAISSSSSSKDDVAEMTTIPLSTPPSNRQKTWVCKGDFCDLEDIQTFAAESSHKPIKSSHPSLSEIKANTDKFKNILNSQNSSVESICRAIPNLESFKSQINPQSTYLNIFKSMYSFMKGFSSSDNDDDGGDEERSFGIGELTECTNITYGRDVSYTEFCERAKVGDMIATHGFTTVSNIICSVQSKLRKGSKYLSHVGMVVDTTVFRMTGMVDNEKYLLESAVVDEGYDTLPDVFGLARSGVQVRSLRTLLFESMKQNTIYFWCPLNEDCRLIFDQNVGINRDKKECAIVSNLHKYLNRPYTLTPANFMLGSSNKEVSFGILEKKIFKALTTYALNKQSKIGEEFFCSELVASIYCDVGILKPKANIPYGQHARDFFDYESISSGFYVPRQVYPIDFFLKQSIIPYLFGNIRIIKPMVQAS